MRRCMDQVLQTRSQRRTLKLMAPSSSTTSTSSSKPMTTTKSTTTSSSSTTTTKSSSPNSSVVSTNSQFVLALVITSLATFVYELFLGHTLEFLKICMQTKVRGETYYEIVQNVTSSKGVLGLLDGFFPWGGIQALVKGAAFGLANAIAYFILTKIFKSSSQVTILAGGIGGFFQGLVLSPLLLLKTHVMTSPSFRMPNMTLFDSCLASLLVGIDLVQQNGLSVLMRGSLFFSLKRVFDWTSRYFFIELVNGIIRRMKGKKGRFSTLDQLLGILLGGILSAFITMPMDSIVSLLQKSPESGELLSLETILHQNQAIELMKRGFLARVAHVVFTTLVMKAAVPFLILQWNNKTKKL